MPFQLIKDSMLLYHVWNTLKAIEKPLLLTILLKEKLNLGKGVDYLLIATLHYDGGKELL